MSTIKINIVSSSEEIFSGEATMVYATGTLGELGIAPGHTPLLTGLAAGPVRVQNGSEEEAFFCSGGFLEVQPDLVTVLSDTAERADSLDESEAIKVHAFLNRMDMAYAAADIIISRAGAGSVSGSNGSGDNPPAA